MPTELSKETANEYFATLNPIATKISIDINETKSSYEHIWTRLSATEQMDIINDTLIRPEIALRYFDNFSTSSSSVSFSNDYTAGEDKLKFCDSLNTKNIYSYDSKHLGTFSTQKTGMKVISDEVFKVFRDEHSAPFSYKTKSQINLKLFSALEQENKNEGNINDMHQVISSLQKYQKLNSGNAGLLSKSRAPKIQLPPIEKSDLKNYAKKDSGKYARFYEEEVDANLPKEKVVLNVNDLNEEDRDEGKSNFLSKFICKNNLIFSAGTNLIIKANQVGQGMEEDEGLNLMKNISYSGLTSSSSVPSEEEEDKIVCEDSKLLLENDELRKGFDFLNNW